MELLSPQLVPFQPTTPLLMFTTYLFHLSHGLLYLRLSSLANTIFE